MDYGKAIRLVALRNVIRQDGQYVLRYIQRWYSKTFATPLHQVDALPLDDVVMAYFESYYEDMKEEDRAKEIESLLETDEQRQARERAEDADQAEREEFARFTAAEDERKAKKKAEAAEKKKIENVVDPRAPRPLRPAPREEPDLPVVMPPPQPKLKELPPEITMKFAELEDVAEELEGLGSFQPPSDDS